MASTQLFDHQTQTVVKQYLESTNCTKTMELEIRITVNGEQYNRILKRIAEIAKEPIEKVYTIEKIYDKIKSIELAENKQMFWQLKKKLKCHDIPEYDIRIAYSSEEEVKEPVNQKIPNLVRKKDRTSYQLECFRIDFTIVNDNNYELELEYIGNKYPEEFIPTVPDAYSAFERLIVLVLQLKQNSIKIVGNSVLKFIRNSWNEFSKSKVIKIYKPLTLTNARLSLLNANDYYITPKIDGQRVFVYILKRDIYIIFNGSNEVCNFNGNNTNESDGVTLLDAEYYNVSTLYIFDILFYNGEDVRSKLLNERLDYLSKLTFSEGCNVLVKKHFHFSEYTELQNIETDGVIFTPIFKPYHNETLKWKHSKYSTIDFYVIIDNSFWYLYVNTTDTRSELVVNGFNMRLFTKIKCETLQLQSTVFKTKTVIEFCWKDTGFVPIRTRHDKIHGNFDQFADEVFDTIKNPVSIAHLLKKNNNVDATELRKFHNWVKSYLWPNYPISTVLDLACGKGCDIHKYNRQHIKEIVLIDINESFIKEGKERLMSLDPLVQKNYTFYKLDVSKENVYSLLTKLNKTNSFQVIVCHFAIHYFFESENTIKTFFQNVSENLNKDGLFIGTCFELNTSVPLVTDLYEIKDNGTKLSVFIKGTEYFKNPIPEPKITFQDILSNASKYNLELVSKSSFKELYTKWGGKLSNVEQQLSFMNSGFIFRKTEYSKHEILFAKNSSRLDTDSLVSGISNLSLVPPSVVVPSVVVPSVVPSVVVPITVKSRAPVKSTVKQPVNHVSQPPSIIVPVVPSVVVPSVVVPSVPSVTLEQLNNMTLVMLKGVAKENKLKQSGTKEELKQRIKDHLKLV